MDKTTEYASFKSFEELLIWQEARDLRKELFLLTNFFPQEEKFRLSNQIIRSSRSVSANIAEGYGRFHYQEFMQFCRQSRGSLQETKDHLICALDCNYIHNTIFSNYMMKIDSLNRKINGFIKHLKTKKELQ
jgi:four helix bundle protein